MGKAGASGAAVGKQRELADDQEGGAGVPGVDVHLFVFVLKDAQTADLVGDFFRLGLGIRLVYAQQHQKADADLTVDLAVDDDGGVFHSCNNSTHIDTFPKLKTEN